MVLACGLWALVVLGLAATAWLDQLLRRAGRPDLAEQGSPMASVLAALSAATVGAVVAVRRPSHPVGWPAPALCCCSPRAGRCRRGRAAGAGGPGPSAPPRWPSWSAWPCCPSRWTPYASIANPLYDLDRIISRTVAYGLLTLLLAGGYVGIVLGLGRLLGRDSSLAVAAAFSPPAAASKPGSTGASTAAATTPPGPSPPSAPACATRWTWTP